jgi:hypothetical protein
MSAKFDARIMIRSVIFFALIGLVVGGLTAHSLNPFSVYASHSLIGKIVVSAAIFFVAAGLLGLLQYWALVAFITKTAKKRASDVICPGCGHALLRFMAVYGKPVICPRCKSWWHYGLNCYKKGAADRRMVMECPVCCAATRGDAESFAASGL